MEMYAPKDIMRIADISRDTYNAWRNRDIIKKIPSVRGRASSFTKADVMHCLIVKTLGAQGISYTIGSQVSKAILQKVEWTKQNSVFVDATTSTCYDVTTGGNIPALIYINLEVLRNTFSERE